VYAAPFKVSSKDVDPSSIPPGYHTQAVLDMEEQIFIAGWRLAALLNAELKNWSGV